MNETCDRCHSRRGQFASGNWRPGQPLTDTHLPAFLTSDLFEDDGQMKDEVFNTSSFSRARCSPTRGFTDCHDPHSGKLRALKSEVCSQCHDPQKFAATSHTGHPQGAGSASTASHAICQPKPTWLSIPGTITRSGFRGRT